MSKRHRDDSSDDTFGPVPTKEDLGELDGPDQKRARKQESKRRFERLHLERIPRSDMYEKSYMHRDIVIKSIVTATGYILTGSVDGHVKFWKKQPTGIEFVKHYVAHTKPLADLVASVDGQYAASLASDGTAKVYDVINFDMMSILELGYNPSAAEWIHENQAATPLLAISSADAKEPYIRIYNVLNPIRDESGRALPIETLKSLHKSPVRLMKYNSAFKCVISIDMKGMIEYWDAAVSANLKTSNYADEDSDSESKKNVAEFDATSEHPFPKARVLFEFKTSTDLYELAKNNTSATSLSITKDGKLFALMGQDRYVRVFRFQTGMLYRKYDETLAFFVNLQKSEGDNSNKLDPIDFGRRQAVEKQIEALWQSGEPKCPPCNVLFDESGLFVLYSTPLGIKLVNLNSNRVVKFLGKVESSERFLQLSLYQGATRGSIAEGNLVTQLVEDPTIFATSFNKARFYLFTKREPEEDDGVSIGGRDVFNEKPPKDDSRKQVQKEAERRIAKSAVIHTTFGDIHIKLFGDKVPKTVENFTVHSKNNYYNGIIFHRVIKNFMVQTGDPLGTGSGGTSIWGREFEDELHPSLKHDLPFTVSMANAVPCPHLDGKHSVFGRVTKGMDVVSSIERVAVTKKHNKPLEDIKIVNIDVDFDQ